MNDPSRQEMAEIGSPTNEKELQGDDRLFQALVSGCHIENAAVAAGISERTAYRRLANPEFRKQINEARQSLRESILARLADAGHDAIGTLNELMVSSEDDRVRFQAAKTLLHSLLATQRHDSMSNRENAGISAKFGPLSIVVRKDSEDVGSLAIGTD
ncbi:hypothetical protein [Rubripirellula reticaptiva]|uniref:Homeodomain phBC6A51-type domain-containing protein n=1 Tax=Rubripirellula reticaptiva TaxID=2528013 RepID=A0A5C6FC70_9BACT|nr:hypothetical protein [Rubripirellula reticaptiva]TWU57676.1 hypothetical protein Poly59_05830 [Rubripirellula reticaptiva]